jgi:hypothetical protein
MGIRWRYLKSRLTHDPLNLHHDQIELEEQSQCSRREEKRACHDVMRLIAAGRCRRESASLFTFSAFQ